MAVVFNFYSDAACTHTVLYPSSGSVYIPTDSPYASISGWTQRDGRVYSAYINRSAGIILSAPAIYDARFQTSKIYDTNPEIVDGNTKNAFFVSANNEYNGNDASYYLQILATMASLTECDITLRVGAYTTANHVYQTSGAPAGVVTAIIPTVSTSQFAGVRAATCNISGKDYIMIAAGVSDSGELSPNGTAVLLIDREYFKTNIPKPYVGPVSKDSAEGSFVPVRPWDDSIPSRTISDANPYGFNSGNGLRLTVLPKALYSYIMQGIYTGYSDSYINAASQLIDRVIGGSGHRPADEVRAIVGGVLCCHSVPALTNYVSGLASDIRTICGYRCFSLAASFPLAGQMIYTIDTARFNLAPRLNSFLDYEPFTAISLHVPFCGMCSLQPSQAYGNDIYLHYVVDIYSGAVSCDVHIVGTTGGKTEYKDYVYTTLQGSFATDMPVMGAGATQSPLQQIAKGVTGITTAQLAANTATGSRAALAAADLKAAKLSAAIGAAETIETAGRGTAIGSASSEGLASYLSNRAVYVIIDRPEPSVPEGYAEMQGVPSHLGGTVGGFSGWTEFEAVDLSSVTQATQAEKEQIIRELKAGVFV